MDKKIPSKEEIDEIIRKRELSEFRPMTDEQRAERLANISHITKHKYGGFVVPPYDPGYVLSRMEDPLSEGDDQVIDRLLNLSLEKSKKEKNERFDKIKKMFGL